MHLHLQETFHVHWVIASLWNCCIAAEVTQRPSQGGSQVLPLQGYGCLATGYRPGACAYDAYRAGTAAVASLFLTHSRTVAEMKFLLIPWPWL